MKLTSDGLSLHTTHHRKLQHSRLRNFEAGQDLKSARDGDSGDEVEYFIEFDCVFDLELIELFFDTPAPSRESMSFAIEVSKDNVFWHKVADLSTRVDARSRNPLSLQLPSAVETRFLRLIKKNGSHELTLADVKVGTFVKRQSQLGQDLWTVAMTDGRVDGWFLEIGSADGVGINNTFLLEKVFHWNGVCVEPNPSYGDNILKFRSAKFYPFAVHKEHNLELEFIAAGELGTLTQYESEDFHASYRKKFKERNSNVIVRTISPSELIRQSGLPEAVDFMSLDTEGSELDILLAFDLQKTKFGLITVEHNFSEPKRTMICDLLKSHGYDRVEAKFDDWYFNRETLDRLNGSSRVNYDHINEMFRKYAEGLC